MEKIYQPQTIEGHWATHWEKAGYFAPNGTGEPYAIALPPPNVTGTLHMGHGFQYALMDALIRHHRMKGDNTLWQPGTDHAGIATQMVVERLLAKDNISRHDLGREKFIERIWDWRDASGTIITKQMRRLGCSLDWTRERYSMDADISHATYAAFIKLFDDGLIYRGKRLVNWDPKLNTAISDLEVDNRSQQGNIWSLRYPLSNGKGHIIVATTRPETLFGDAAVAVHPEDERYQSLIGQTVVLPLCEREIPIIADEYVDKAFGSGCVKITPAHDFNDHEIGLRHDLPMINIMQLDATLNDAVPEAYRGLDRFVAREKIIADLTNAALLESVDQHTNTLPYGDRSGVIIEPLLTDQWFVKADVLAKPAIDAVNAGKLHFVPEQWTKVYLQWLENIQDWCISRQLWWGHRIPVWYDDAQTPYTGYDEADVRARYSLDDTITLTQDEDTLDTWFTAALWPFSSLGWPKNTEALQTFYPTSVLVTGFDIIFFWVARMVMMGLYFVGEVPFREVYITGLIRDQQGQKMSKSKGNVLDPIDLIDGISLDALIEKRVQGLMQPQMANKIKQLTTKQFPEGIAAHGTDALRFTFCALATTGRDINFDMGRLEGYRNFCNKLWNAARFVFMQCEGHPIHNKPTNLQLADRWIISRLQDTITAVNADFERYRLDLVAQRLYDFIWNEYCDWYLEFAKCDPNDGTRHTLISVLETCLRLLHPLMPFITEEIWQTAKSLLDITADSIMLQPYPVADGTRVDAAAVDEMEWVKKVILAIRNLRGEMGISPSKTTPLILSKGSAEDKKRLTDCALYLNTLAKIETLSWESNTQNLPASAKTVVDDLAIYLPLAGLIEKDAELARLTKTMEKLEKERTKCEAKLNNPNYTQKAPTEVVAKERDRLNELSNTLNTLSEHYRRIEKL